MAKFNIELLDELATEFRIKIVKIRGSLRGNMDWAFTEAVRCWVEENDDSAKHSN